MKNFVSNSRNSGRTFRSKLGNFIRTERPLLKEFLGELIGTSALVLFGCGCIAQVVLGSLVPPDFGGFLSICLGWGIAVYIGLLLAGKSGRGHINPALSVAFALIGKLDVRRLFVYLAAQYIGAFLGALVLYSIYMEQIWTFHDQNLPKNSTGNVDWNKLSSIFATFPNASLGTCFMDQVLGTGLLMAGVLAIVDKRNFNIPDWAQPLHVLFLFTGLVLTLGFNAGAALNPARDFAPRVVIALFYSGTNAFSGGDYYFWVPIVGPHVGAIIGALVYELAVGLHLPKDEQKSSKHVEDTELEALST